MKTITDIFIRVIEILFTLEFLAIPGAFWLNEKEPAIIDLKSFLINDAVVMLITIFVGILLIELTKPKNENKTRR